MTTTADTPIVAPPPSQLALDNLVETLDALLHEARTLIPSGRYSGFAQILLSGVAPEVWHALPHAVIAPRDRSGTWKKVAVSGRAEITVFCDHGTACPDLPPLEERP